MGGFNGLYISKWFGFGFVVVVVIVGGGVEVRRDVVFCAQLFGYHYLRVLNLCVSFLSVSKVQLNQQH